MDNAEFRKLLMQSAAHQRARPSSDPRRRLEADIEKRMASIRQATALLGSNAEVKGFVPELDEAPPPSERVLASTRGVNEEGDTWNSSPGSCDVAVRSTSEYFIKNLHPLGKQFQSSLSRLWKHLAGGGKFKNNPSTFHQGRTTYVFDAEFSLSAKSDVPRTVLKTSRAAETPQLVTVALKNDIISGVKRNLAGPSEWTSTRPPADDIVDDDDDQGIFADVGKFDAAAATEQIRMEQAAINDREAVALANRRQAEANREETLMLKKGVIKLQNAARKRALDDAREADALEAEKRRLEKPPDEPLPAEANPFSLKNASVMPLINKGQSGLVRIERKPTSEGFLKFQDRSEMIDAEYGITVYDFDEWRDDEDPLSFEEKARYKLTKIFSEKLAKEETDPDVKRRVEKAIEKSKLAKSDKGLQLKKIHQLLQSKKESEEPTAKRRREGPL